MTRILLDLPAHWDTLRWASDPRAVCASSEIDYWFTERGQEWKERHGVWLCFHCPIRQTCLEHALNKPERVGTWGGTTANQRGRYLEPLWRDGTIDIDTAMEITLTSAERRGIVRKAGV